MRREVNWILISGNYYYSSCSLHKDYVSVLLGKTTTQSATAGPFEQISRIDCIHVIPNSKIVLLHLERLCHYSRAVLPTM